MNRLTAVISLYFITFFAAVQYAFLSAIPDSVSSFAFLAVTNLIGFLITLCAFFGELKRLDAAQVRQSAVLSLELFGFNIFLLLGSRGADPTLVAGILSSYFAFIVLLSFLIFHRVPEKSKVVAVGIVLLGVFMTVEANPARLLSSSVLYLIAADLFFALYLLTAERYSASSNPSILAMGQTLFTFVLTLGAWIAESLLLGRSMALPPDPAFWSSVFFISFFIRGLYGIVQIYAQRYVSPLSVSLIFSTEIIMTMLASPLLAALFGTEAEPITPLKLLGALVMVCGILLADSAVVDRLKRRGAK